MRRPLAPLLLTALLVACGPGRSYDLSRPIQVIAADPSVGVEVAFVSTAIISLGGQPTLFPSEQQVRVELRPQDDAACEANWAYSPPGVVAVCPDLPASDHLKIKDLMYHELGHVLGAQHLPCGIRAVMTPFNWCYTPPDLAAGDRIYTDFDFAEICRLTRGGLCTRGAGT